MTIKKSKTVADAPIEKNPNDLRGTPLNEKSRERQLAELSFSATTLNANTAHTFVKGMGVEVDLTESFFVMREKAAKVNSGDISELEATLAAQAVSLDTIFNELARRAAMNMGQQLHATESYMRLALKAQAQCARTIEALATIKNPPVVIAKQANITNGPQQVNNGASAHAGKIKKQQTKLIKRSIYGTVDTRGKAAAIGVDQELETVGAIYRPDNAKG